MRFENIDVIVLLAYAKNHMLLNISTSTVLMTKVYQSLFHTNLAFKGGCPTSLRGEKGGGRVQEKGG